MEDVTIKFDIEPGSMILAQAHVCQYLAPDGTTKYAHTYFGNAPITTFIGLLEVAKIDLVIHQERGDGDDGE